jgi:hypothetical protein
LENKMTTETPKHVPHVTPTTPVTNTSAKVAPAHTTPKAKVSPNVIQPSPTPETLVAEPKQPNRPLHSTPDDTARRDARARGYSIGPNEPAATIKVKNIHTIALNLEAGIIQPGATGLATEAEVSNLLDQYLERL